MSTPSVNTKGEQSTSLRLSYWKEFLWSIAHRQNVFCITRQRTPTKNYSFGGFQHIATFCAWKDLFGIRFFFQPCKCSPWIIRWCQSMQCQCISTIILLKLCSRQLSSMDVLETTLNTHLFILCFRSLVFTISIV